MKQELLSPAGDIEAGFAAFYYGADAVYLGLQQFSARATAANFTPESLGELTRYAHSLGKKVYVAINTVLGQDEINTLLQTLDACQMAKADAVIVQDLGVARVIRESYPELELHASTQMAVHNKQGALALQKLGFKRVVLARELSLPEIKEIASIPGLETESFIHGALCYSYSGLCLFSSLETGKSANRGKCLYPCRACFTGKEGSKHFFSMKDMALKEDVLKMPVTSLKIEGRKKTALYVAAVTDYYRRLLDDKISDESRAENICQIFSRPWTKLHFLGKNKDVIDRDFVGHRGLLIGQVETAFQGKVVFKTTHSIARYDGIQIDVPGQEKPFGFSLEKMRVKGKSVFEAKAGEKVEVELPPHSPFLKKGYAIYLASSSAVKGAYAYSKPKPGQFKPRTPLDVTVILEKQKISAAAMGFSAEVAGSFEVAQNLPKVEQAVQEAFAKTGETDLTLRGLTFENKSGLFVPVSLLNELRRQLYTQIIITPQRRSLPSVDTPLEHQKPRFIIKTDNLDTLAKIDLTHVAEITVLLRPDFKIEQLKSLPKNKIRLALPTVCRTPQVFAMLVDNLIAQGYRKWEIGNVWGLTLLPSTGIDLSFDTPLYMMNTQAIQMAKEIGARRIAFSVEDTLDNLQKIAPLSPLLTTFVIYQDAPLFTSANCIRSHSCKTCSHGRVWTTLTKDGQTYDVLSENCQTFLFSQKPLCFASEALTVPADFYRIDFVMKPYTPDQAAALFEMLRNFKDIKGTQKANMKRMI